MLQQRGTGGVPGESLNLKVAPKGRVALEEASSQQLFFKCVPNNAGPEPRQPDSRGLGGCTRGTGAASLCSKMSSLSSSISQHLVHLQLSLSSREWPRSSQRSGT